MIAKARGMEGGMIGRPRDIGDVVERRSGRENEENNENLPHMPFVRFPPREQ